MITITNTPNNHEVHHLNLSLTNQNVTTIKRKNAKLSEITMEIILSKDSLICTNRTEKLKNKKRIPAKHRWCVENLATNDRLAYVRHRRGDGTVRLGLLSQCSVTPCCAFFLFSISKFNCTPAEIRKNTRKSKPSSLSLPLSG